MDALNLAIRLAVSVILIVVGQVAIIMQKIACQIVRLLLWGALLELSAGKKQHAHQHTRGNHA